MSYENRYGLLDRWLHRLAFHTGPIQCSVADLEDRIFRRELRQIDVGPPVLITALPRAGTTIFLELLAGLPEFAAHTYRDMPFVLTPMLWSRMSRPFRRADTPRERMHGDGIRISLDSPEALEEVLWKRFWPKRYHGPYLEPWPSCQQPEFSEFFAAHTRKVIALRRVSKPTAHRYLSKNNLNIARIACLHEAIPNAKVLVMVREPQQHATSLLRQHLRFNDRHTSDPFSRQYMKGIGHFDFGQNLKPVDFDGWYSNGNPGDPTEKKFWLRYWLATYQHVLQQRSKVTVIAFENLLRVRDFSALRGQLGLENDAALQQAASKLRPPAAHETDHHLDALDEQATQVYQHLCQHCLLRS